MDSDSPVHTASVPDAVLDQIRLILAGRVVWCPLPSPVNAVFARRRRDEFAMIARIGWPLLLFMVMAVGGGGWWLFGAEMHGADKVVWWQGIALELLVLAVAMIVVQHPRVLPHYQGLIIVAGILNLGIALLGSIILESQRLAQIDSYVCMLIITIQVLALRLSLWASALCGFGGLVLAVS